MAPLISFSADAYTIETTALLNAFSQSTGVPVAPVKSGGSFADANQIAAGAPDDVFISVALSATAPQYLKNLSSNWAIGFASDQMVLAYSNATLSSSSAATIVGQGNAAAKSNATSDWNTFFTSLVSGNVKVGISDPVADPAGLRGWLVLEAAGFLYASGNQGAYVTSLLQAKANVTGAHAAALVAPLQSGQIQFLFIYKSAAIADHLGYLIIDRHVNLGDPTLGAFYSKFSYKDSAGVTAGAPIILCITIPLSSVNTSEALEFVQYVVKNAGTLSSYGLQPFSPARLYSNVAPPAPISELVSQGLIVQAGSLP
jgi:molybdate/tungstate transport system substrate-binding protein